MVTIFMVLHGPCGRSSCSKICARRPKTNQNDALSKEATHFTASQLQTTKYVELAYAVKQFFNVSRAAFAQVVAERLMYRNHWIPDLQIKITTGVALLCASIYQAVFQRQIMIAKQKDSLSFCHIFPRKTAVRLS